MRSKSLLENSDKAEAVIKVLSLSLPKDRDPPIERSSSLICLLVRVSVPSLATAAEIWAMPACFFRSAAAPAPRNVRIVVSFGTLGNGASTTVNPLLSFFSVICGRLSGLIGPGGGGVFCWAVIEVAHRIDITRAAIDNRPIGLRRFILFASFRLGLGFGYSINNRAISRYQIFLRDRFNFFAGDLLKRRQ